MYYINNLLGVVLVIILFLGILWITMKEGHRILAGWARENSFELLEAEHCWFWRGPFWFRSSKARAFTGSQCEISNPGTPGRAGPDAAIGFGVYGARTT